MECWILLGALGCWRRRRCDGLQHTNVTSKTTRCVADLGLFLQVPHPDCLVLRTSYKDVGMYFAPRDTKDFALHKSTSISSPWGWCILTHLVPTTAVGDEQARVALAAIALLATAVNSTCLRSCTSPCWADTLQTCAVPSKLADTSCSHVSAC